MTEHNQDHTETAATTPAWRRLLSFFQHAPEPSAVHRLYSLAVNHARFPLYYDDLGVADTPEGRFEILALHVGLIIRRLVQERDRGGRTAQALIELMVADLDGNLRELGVGDLSVGKQVKRLASQFNARIDVLTSAFDQGDRELLLPMLATNAYHGITEPPTEQVTALMEVCEAIEASLAGQAVSALAEGRIHLPDEQALCEICRAR